MASKSQQDRHGLTKEPLKVADMISRVRIDAWMGLYSFMMWREGRDGWGCKTVAKRVGSGGEVDSTVLGIS